MNVLEKILEEIDSLHNKILKDKFAEKVTEQEIDSLVKVKEIIRSHMNEVAGTNISVNSDLIDRQNLKEEIESLRMKIIGTRSRKIMIAQVLEEYKKSILRIIDEQPTIYADDGWIPVSKRLPEPDKMVVVTVHCSEWISDYDSVWVSEDEKIHHSEEYLVGIGCIDKDGDWIFYDQDGCEFYCDKELGSDKSNLYIVATAWQPLSEPYKGD